MGQFNHQFKYSGELQIRILPKGVVTCTNYKIEAISDPAVTPVEAVNFYASIIKLLPNGWATNAVIEMLDKNAISITGCLADPKRRIS